MDELDFSGRQVLVVGGSSGIGNGIAQAFRAKGANVAVCGTRAHDRERPLQVFSQARIFAQRFEHTSPKAIPYARALHLPARQIRLFP